MLTRLYLALTLAAAAAAQQVVAPTDAQVGPPRGENMGEYNVTQSWEFGYRFRTVGGDLGMYRSVVNYGNGLRLLGSHLTVNSREGHGHLFDEILLNTSGLGNDPYQAVMLRVQKNGLYRYDISWRLNEYYNPALTVAGNQGLNGTPVLTVLGPSSVPGLLSTGGLHIRDTNRRMQDHDLTLFPQSRFRFRVGYSRNVEDGPALSTAQEFDPLSNDPAFPIFADIRRQWNEYRVGADIDLAGFRFTVSRRWDFFKEDTPYSLIAVLSSAAPDDQTALRQFRRSEPVHGDNPGWLGNLVTRRRLWGINARATYVSGSRNFIEDELALGTTRFGGPASRQILVGGNASRPNVAGDFAINFFPTDNLTVVNNTSIMSNRIDGTSSYSEVLNGSDLGQTINFRFLGIRTVTNSTDVNYRVTKQIGLYAAYRYSDREIRSTRGFESPAFPTSADSESYRVSNHLNSGVLGVRVRPWKPFSISLDGEIGRANFPLTPISEKRYHNINGRADYRTRRTQLSTSYRQAYNLNAPFTFSTFNSHSRQYSASASWAPRDAISFDASYTKLHLDTRGGIAFFASTGIRPQLQSAFPSYYTSNIHAGNLGVRLAMRRRADLYLGFTITKDTGDGRATAVPTATTNPIEALVTSVQTFPLTYSSPLARLSIRITPKVRWNAGWQFYDYAEDFHFFGYNQNFRAHTGFTSVLWSF
jgi:hypothetical protein